MNKEQITAVTIKTKLTPKEELEMLRAWNSHLELELSATKDLCKGLSILLIAVLIGMIFI